MRESITNNDAAGTLQAAREALNEGDWAKARRLCRQASRLNPDDAGNWLWQAMTAESEEEYLLSLSRIVEQEPHHETARQWQYGGMRRLLENDPFLAYVGEDEVHYQVRTPKCIVFTIPKDREFAPPFPPAETSAVQRAWRWLGVAILGLPLAGVGTLLAAPVAATFAVRAGRERLDRQDRMRVRIILLCAFLLWSAGLFLFILLLLHMV
jgi:hypothetical protein